MTGRKRVADRMTIEEVVKDVMVREYGDVLRAAVEAVCAPLMPKVGHAGKPGRRCHGRAMRRSAAYLGAPPLGRC